MLAEHHCYFIPYYINSDNNVEVLLGKKVLYSDQQGFFMSNPKQWVPLGGNCGLTKDKKLLKGDTKRTLIKAFQEFVEETGITEIDLDDIDKSMIFEYTGSKYSFDVYFVNVNERMKNKIVSVKREKTDMYYSEIDKITWVPLNIAITLLNEYNSYNKYKVTMDAAKLYLEDFKERHKYWRLEESSFYRNFHDFYMANRGNVRDFKNVNELISHYKKNGKSVSFKLVSLFRAFMDYMIKDRMHVDWFYGSFKLFLEDLQDGKLGEEVADFLKDQRPLHGEEKSDLIDNFINTPSRDKIPTSFSDMIKMRKERGDKVIDDDDIYEWNIPTKYK